MQKFSPFVHPVNRLMPGFWRQKSCRLLIIQLCLALGSALVASAADLPISYDATHSLGAFPGGNVVLNTDPTDTNLPGRLVYINTNHLININGTNYCAVARVFDYASINIPYGSSVTATGRGPLILTSGGDIYVSGTVSMNGGDGGASTNSGGAGGGGGGSMTFLANGAVYVDSSAQLSANGGDGGTGVVAVGPATLGGFGGFWLGSGGSGGYGGQAGQGNGTGGQGAQGGTAGGTFACVPFYAGFHDPSPWMYRFVWVYTGGGGGGGGGGAGSQVGGGKGTHGAGMAPAATDGSAGGVSANANNFNPVGGAGGTGGNNGGAGGGGGQRWHDNGNGQGNGVTGVSTGVNNQGGGGGGGGGLPTAQGAGGIGGVGGNGQASGAGGGGGGGGSNGAGQNGAGGSGGSGGGGGPQTCMYAVGTFTAGTYPSGTEPYGGGGGGGTIVMASASDSVEVDGTVSLAGGSGAPGAQGGTGIMCVYGNLTGNTNQVNAVVVVTNGESLGDWLPCGGGGGGGGGGSLGYCGVLVDDSWVDGDRNNQNLPFESAWFASDTSSLTAAPGTMIGTVQATNAALWLTYFGPPEEPCALAVGDTLKATMVFTPSNVATGTPPTSRGLRIGLFNYAAGGTRVTNDTFSAMAGNGTNVQGYIAEVNFVQSFTAKPLQFDKRTNTVSTNLMGTLADYTALGNGPSSYPTPGFSNGIPYTMEFTIKRTGPSVFAITNHIYGGSYLDISFGVRDTNYVNSFFDGFALRPARADSCAGMFTISRFRVEKITAPQPFTMPITYSVANSLGALNLTGTATFNTDPDTGGSPYGTGRTAMIYTNYTRDGINYGTKVRVFDFSSVAIQSGATLTATGPGPLILTSGGELYLSGTINVSGGDGQSNPDLGGAGGGGGGGGAVALFANGNVNILSGGQIMACGGSGGQSYCAAPASGNGSGGIAVAGGGLGGMGGIIVNLAGGTGGQGGNGGSVGNGGGGGGGGAVSHGGGGVGTDGPSIATNATYAAPVAGSSGGSTDGGAGGKGGGINLNNGSGGTAGDADGIVNGGQGGNAGANSAAGGGGGGGGAYTGGQGGNGGNGGTGGGSVGPGQTGGGGGGGGGGGDGIPVGSGGGGGAGGGGGTSGANGTAGQYLFKLDLGTYYYPYGFGGPGGGGSCVIASSSSVTFAPSATCSTSGGVATNSPIAFANGGLGTVAVYAPSLTMDDSTVINGQLTFSTNGVTQGEWQIYGGGGGGGGGGGAYPHPVISPVSWVSATDLVINGTHGWPESTYCLLMSTNVTLPMMDWTPVTTNVFDIFGCCTNTIATDPSDPQRFYRLETSSP